ncbi:MAG: YceK/YidQ family lipoprotein [Planctomycetaceae bacterium]|jgi:uncharacterized protein YceK|nr:YceK/YidQ family lipoprotein [Planctomycetaceae bacterium]
MRLFLVIIPLLLSFAQTGCASLGVRTGMYSERADLYPATAVDAGVVAYVATRPFASQMDPTFTPDAQEGLVYLFLPASIIDLPFAVAVDTLLLPYDIHKARKRQSDHDAKVESLRTAGPVPVPPPTL